MPYSLCTGCDTSPRLFPVYRRSTHPSITLFPAYLNALHILYRDYSLTPLHTYPPAGAADLAAAEAALDFALDPALKATWQSTNGSDEWQTVFARPGYITGYSFLSLADSLREHEYMAHRAPQYDGYEQEQPRDPRICSGWYQAGWLPFAAFSAPDLLLIADHSPTASGQCGQIIAFSHDPDTISYVCTDFATLLEQSLATIREHPEDCLPEE